jgi:hypothetical protein
VVEQRVHHPALDIRKAAATGVPVLNHEHSANCHEHGSLPGAHQLFCGIEAARNRFADFWGSGCDCFAFQQAVEACALAFG